MRYSYENIIYHFDQAEMTPELCEDLINFSVDDLQHVLHSYPRSSFRILGFMPKLLSRLKRLV